MIRDIALFNAASRDEPLDKIGLRFQEIMQRPCCGAITKVNSSCTTDSHSHQAGKSFCIKDQTNGINDSGTRKARAAASLVKSFGAADTGLSFFDCIETELVLTSSRLSTEDRATAKQVWISARRIPFCSELTAIIAQCFPKVRNLGEPS